MGLHSDLTTCFFRRQWKSKTCFRLKSEMSPSWANSFEHLVTSKWYYLGRSWNLWDIGLGQTKWVVGLSREGYTASGTDVGCIGVLAAYFCSWGTALFDGHSPSVDWVKFSLMLFQNQALSQQQEKVTILCNNSIPLSSNSSLLSLQFLATTIPPSLWIWPL